MEDDTLIDITSDQFDFFSRNANGVYVGKENSFYRHIEDIKFYRNHDITTDARLWNGYRIIMHHIGL